MLVAGGVLAWLGLIPLLTVVTPAGTIAAQLVKPLPGEPVDGRRPRRLDPATHAFADSAAAVYRAYVARSALVPSRRAASSRS